MRIVVIGGSGHIGSYLSPRLVEAGHAVICVSRGLRRPYQEHNAWSRIQQVVLDRTELEARGEFGRSIAELGADAVIDITCFTKDSAEQLATPQVRRRYRPV